MTMWFSGKQLEIPVSNSKSMATETETTKGRDYYHLKLSEQDSSSTLSTDQSHHEGSTSAGSDVQMKNLSFQPGNNSSITWYALSFLVIETMCQIKVQQHFHSLVCLYKLLSSLLNVALLFLRILYVLIVDFGLLLQEIAFYRYKFCTRHHEVTCNIKS